MKRVLIVEDSYLMSDFIKALLEKNGFEVVGRAENGSRGVALYHELRPDIVTMDIAMPEMDGLNALKCILELDTGAKVVIISALSQQQIMDEAMQYGAIVYITKPFQPEALVGTLKALPG